MSTDDEDYGTAPSVQGLDALKAFNALPEPERREAIRRFVQHRMDRLGMIVGTEYEPFEGPIAAGTICRAKRKRPT